MTGVPCVIPHTVGAGPVAAHCVGEDCKVVVEELVGVAVVAGEVGDGCAPYGGVGDFVFDILGDVGAGEPPNGEAGLVPFDCTLARERVRKDPMGTYEHRHPRRRC